MGRRLYFDDLLETLRSATSYVSRDFEQNLYFQLENAKPKFFELFDIPPPKTKEKQEIEKGTAKLHGRSVPSHFNENFKREALFLAQQLDCSEIFCAELIDDAAVIERFGRRATAENAVIRLHEERANLLEALRLIVEKATQANGASPGLGGLLPKFAIELMTTPIDLGGGKGIGRLSEKMLLEIDNLRAGMDKIRVSLQSAPTATSSTSFGDAILRQRLERMKEERQQLGHLLYIFSASREIDRPGLIKMVRWLSTVDAGDELRYFILTSILAALDTSSEWDTVGGAYSLLNDREVMVQMHSTLEQSTWKVPGLKAAVSLQWSLWVLEARTQDPHIQGNIRGIAEDVEKIVESGIKSDGFQFLTQLVLRSRSQNYDADDVLNDTGTFIGADIHESIDSGFRSYFLQQLDALLQQLILRMSSVLRRIRTKEDDADSAAARNLRIPVSGAGDPPRRHDTSALFLLMAVIYAELPPDAGLKYWQDDYDGHLNAFLHWATEARRFDVTMATYEMLASLAKGPACALEAFNFLTTNGGHYNPGPSQYHGPFSWSTLFNSLYSTSETLAKSRAPAPQNPFGRQFGSLPTAVSPGSLSPQEVGLLRSFLRILRNVACYSTPARESIKDQQDLHALQTLFTLVSYPIPLELKASLYQTLAAFCGGEGGPSNAETIRTMWGLLDRSDVIRPSASLGPGGGAVQELEQVETPAKTYPASIALIELLNSLLIPSKRSPPTQSYLDTEPSTIPDSVVQGRRIPVLGPYIDFVINNVLLQAGSRGYSSSAERFRLLNGCIEFLERCLRTFDLSILQSGELSAAGVQNPFFQESLIALQTHPGFDVLSRILNNDSPLRNELFLYVNEGYGAIEEDLAKTSYFNDAVRGVLRIIRRVLELQSPFLDLLLPALPLVSGMISFEPPRTLASLDQYMIWFPDIVPKIGMYVNRTEDQEMMLLSIEIISAISDLPVFNVVDSTLPGVARRLNRLMVILDRDPCTPDILDGFVRVLNAESPTAPLDSEEVLPPKGSTAPDDFSEAVKAAIMKLLLRNTAPGRPAPNISHLLLGYSVRVPQSEMVIQDPDSLGGRQTLLQAVLDLLNLGIPKLDSMDAEKTDDREIHAEDPLWTLYERNPVFAKQCYRLLYQLAKHEYTSQATLRYLRTREDFIHRHLSVIPGKAPAEERVSSGYAAYSDRTRAPSSCRSLVSFLQLRTSLLECTALELHALHGLKQWQRLTRLLELLFKATTQPHTRQKTESELTDSIFLGGHVAQPLFRMLEIFESLDFKWVDSIPNEDLELQFYDRYSFTGCLYIDEDGCELFSQFLVAGVIGRMRKQLQKQATGPSDAQLVRFKGETHHILQKRLKENRELQVEHAKLVSFAAWRHVLELVLVESFNRLTSAWREQIVLDILQAIPDFLHRSQASPFTASSLSELMLSLSTRLRQDRIYSFTTFNQFSSLPTDRLQGIFRSTLQCTLRTPTSERLRGNSYATLTNFIHMAVSAGSGSRRGSSDAAQKYWTSSFSSRFDESTRDSGLSQSILLGSTIPQSGLQAGMLDVINGVADRLVPTVCRDAADGSEIWKTVAFTFLDALVQMSRLEKAHRVLNVMTREGFLKTFLQTVKTAEDDMLAVLKPDPDNLNPLYVYESKLSLLIRVAQTKQGSERLLDSRVFAILTNCEFLDARPQNDHAFLDFDSFLPSAVERYHQLIAPVLQLAVSVLSAAGHSNVVSKQALGFILAHRTTILTLLSDHVEDTTLASLKETRLLIAMCSFILPAVDDLLVPSGFGAIHTAILALAARCMSSKRIQDNVVPANDVELGEVQTPVQGYGKDSRASIFSEKVDEAVSDLRMWLAIYLADVTDLKGAFKPVLAPVITSTSEVDILFTRKQSVPTLTDAALALRLTIQEFHHAQGNATTMAEKLDHPGAMAAEEVSEIIDASKHGSSDPTEFKDNPDLALRELEASWARYQKTALRSLLWLETLLLLLWKHVEFFVVDGPSRDPSGRTDGIDRYHGLNSSHSQASAKRLQDLAQKELVPLLEELEELPLAVNVVGKDCTTRSSYIRLIARRLRTVLSREDVF